MVGAEQTSETRRFSLLPDSVSSLDSRVDPLKEGSRLHLEPGRFDQTSTESSGVCGGGLTILDKSSREERGWEVLEVLRARREKTRRGCAKYSNKQ